MYLSCKKNPIFSEGKSYLCCNQLFQWRKLMTKEDEMEKCICVTKTKAYISSVNHFAVKGECYKLRIMNNI